MHKGNPLEPKNSTKPLALRKRNRDPYNPQMENKDYLQYEMKDGKLFCFKVVSLFYFIRIFTTRELSKNYKESRSL